MKHINHSFNKFINYINMNFSKSEFEKIWGNTATDHLWEKYNDQNNGNFLAFYSGLDNHNKDKVIDYLDKNA